MKKRILLLYILLGAVAFAQEGPEARGSFPRGGAEAIIRNAFISVLISGGPLDSATVNKQSVKLYPIGRPDQAVPAFVIYREDLRNITLEPFGLLLPKTGYTFEISSAVTDQKGNPFKPYVATFNTGEKALRKMITMRKEETFGTPPGVISEDTTTYIDVDEMIAQAEAAWEAQNEESKHVLPKISMVKVPRQSGVSLPQSTARPIVAEKVDAPAPIVPEKESLLIDEVAMQSIRLRSDAFALENELMPLFVPMIDKVDLLPPPSDLEMLIVLGQLVDEASMPSDEDLAMGIEPGKEETTEVTPGLSAAGRIIFEKGSRVRLGQNLEITFEFDFEEQVSMKLRTYAGEVMLTERGRVYPGRRTRAVKINGIPPGTYYAVFESESFKTTRKVIVTR